MESRGIISNIRYTHTNTPPFLLQPARSSKQGGRAAAAGSGIVYVMSLPGLPPTIIIYGVEKKNIAENVMVELL